jgi:cobalamin biosynthesis Mg chelatase CobN
MISRWAYILVGNDKTGKTTFQKRLISILCDKNKDKRLKCNQPFDITHPRMPRGVKNLSVMNRSYQEKKDYKSIDDFFQKGFQEADICILSSHAHKPNANDVQEMINNLRHRAYNVAAVFFSNTYKDVAEEIRLLDWDERLTMENPPLKSTDEEAIDDQLLKAAHEFAYLLIARAPQQV